MTGAPPALPSWQARREAGARRHLVRLMAWLCRHLGWRVGAMLLYPITLWFFLADGAARAASRRYLGRVMGKKPGVWAVFRHFHTFAQTVLDRFFLLDGDGKTRFEIGIEGIDHLARATAAGKGVLLLGAHLGSFDLLRLAAGRSAPAPVRMVMHHRERDALTALYEACSPDFAASVIALPAAGEDGIALALALRETLAAGGTIGLLADRPAAGQQALAVDFLGSPALFPLGPFRLAAATGAPVLLGFGLRLGRRRYLVRIEPLAEVIPRARTSDDVMGYRVCGPWAALSPYVIHYAERLAALCREHPYNWFNFHDVWEIPRDAEPIGGPFRRSSHPRRSHPNGVGGGGIHHHRADG